MNMMTMTVARIKQVACGDWHDKPLRYAVNGPGVEVQQFSTKKDAQKYAAIRRCSESQLNAIRQYAGSLK